jgi:hypothetical protein
MDSLHAVMLVVFRLKETTTSSNFYRLLSQFPVAKDLFIRVSRVHSSCDWFLRLIISFSCQNCDPTDLESYYEQVPLFI